MTSTTELLRI